MDVDIHTIEHKPWTYPGADVTDYFNFGFDEESWRNYCRSLVGDFYLFLRNGTLFLFSDLKFVKI